MRDVYTVAIRYKYRGEIYCYTALFTGNSGATDADIKYAVLDQIIPAGAHIIRMDSVVVSNKTLLSIVEVAKEKGLV
jgi:hypothetical protein